MRSLFFPLHGVKRGEMIRSVVFADQVAKELARLPKQVRAKLQD